MKAKNKNDLSKGASALGLLFVALGFTHAADVHAQNGCTAMHLPATIEAEAYCQASGIQTETTSDIGGGQNVGWIDAGDWLAYSIHVPSAGEYNVSYRVASVNGATLQLEGQGGSPVYGQINVPATGGWQDWLSVSHTVTLAAGEQNIAIAALTGGWNINHVELRATDTAALSDAYYLINDWQNAYLYDNGEFAAYASAPAGTRFHWLQESLGDGVYEFRNVATGDYLHIEGLAASVQASTRNPVWQSARWRLLDTGGENVRLQSHWREDHFIHIENLSGNAEYGLVNADWASAQWRLARAPLTSEMPTPTPTPTPTPEPVDTDDDGVLDTADNCPNEANTAQEDLDGDGDGDICDLDIDGDGFSNEHEIIAGTDGRDPASFPDLNADDDGDGVINNQDQCPETLADTRVDDSGCALDFFHMIQVEDYSRASDSSVGNEGGVYRDGDVDIEPSSDEGGGFSVGWIASEEWLAFDNITIPESGNYQFRVRYSAVSDKRVSFDFNSGSIALGEFTLPATGGWHNWQTVTLDTQMQAGTYSLGIFMVEGAWNLNWVEIVSGGDGDIRLPINPVINLNSPHTEPLIPKWALGYWQSAWGADSLGYGHQNSFLDHARALRGQDNQYGAHLHPADVIVLDMFWNGLEWNWPGNMTWDFGRFSDPEGMIRELHAMNFKIALNYHEGGFGQQWLNQMRRDLEWGTDIVWLDFWRGDSSQEAQVWNLLGDVNGHDKRRMFMARHYARPNHHNNEPILNGHFMEAPNEEEFEKTMPVHWTGDVLGTWEGFAESIEGIVYGEDGAMGGWSYLHTDTPGHTGGEDPEIATRWIQFSDFSPLTRNHGTTGRDVWRWGPKVEENSYHSRMLRYRLLPYIYTYAWKIWETAVPLTRPFKLAFPGQRDDIRYQYMFGEELMVAPVYRAAADFPGERMPVFLPEGEQWIDYWTHEVHDGGQTIHVDVSVENNKYMPLFVKRGAIIPMGPEIHWIDPAVHADPLTVDIYPLEQGVSSFTLYDDDGESTGYERGDFAQTQFTVTGNSGDMQVTIGAAIGNYSGKPQQQNYLLKINLTTQSINSVTLGGTSFNQVSNYQELLGANGANNRWAVDAQNNTLYVRFSTSTSVANTISINR